MISLLTHLRGSLEGVINSTAEDSSDYRIAMYLLEHCYVATNLSIQDVADHCFVSKSTVSRFCRQLGYQDFKELNQALYQGWIRSNTLKFRRYISRDSFLPMYLDEVAEGVEMLRQSVRQEDLDEIVQDLKSHSRVGLLGKLQSNSVAVDLQHDLSVSHKITTAPVIPEQQRCFIENSDENTFLFVISCSGSYIRGFINPQNFSGRKRPKITLLTNNPEMQLSKLYDKVIVLPCENTYAKCPILNKMYCNLIVLNYAKSVF